MLRMIIRSIVEAARPRQQVIVKFLDKSNSEGLASVVGVVQNHVVGIGSVVH